MKRASFHAWVLSVVATILAGLLVLAIASTQILAQETPPEEINEIVTRIRRMADGFEAQVTRFR